VSYVPISGMHYLQYQTSEDPGSNPGWISMSFFRQISKDRMWMCTIMHFNGAQSKILGVLLASTLTHIS